MILFHILTSSDITSSNKHFIIMIRKTLSHEMTILDLHFAELFLFQVKTAAVKIRPINISSILTKMHPAAFQSIIRRFFYIDGFVCLEIACYTFRD